ncbi:MAG: hypothetical protein J2P17_07785 [Mycobacterium sp.]|nr:hypothetical protein [Mycobacterium sp.]
MPSPERLYRFVEEHIAAENDADPTMLARGILPTLRYDVAGPRYPDDPEPFNAGGGPHAYLEYWRNISNWFTSYHASIEKIVPFVDQNRAMVFATINAVPAIDFERLTVGKPYVNPVTALVEFADDGRLARKSLYASMIMIRLGLHRMHGFLMAASKGDTAWQS